MLCCVQKHSNTKQSTTTTNNKLFVKCKQFGICKWLQSFAKKPKYNYLQIANCLHFANNLLLIVGGGYVVLRAKAQQHNTTNNNNKLQIVCICKQFGIYKWLQKTQMQLFVNCKSFAFCKRFVVYCWWWLCCVVCKYTTTQHNPHQQ